MSSDSPRPAFQFPKVFFVAGTDTDVGKTVVSGILALGLSAHYWKPIQSGQEINPDNPGGTDSTWIKACGVKADHVLPERYIFSQPLSPHLASRLDGKSVMLSELNLPDLDEFNHLIIEGAGGLLVPLNDNDKVIDHIKQLEVPVLLVARSKLGTINHTLLSLEALRSRDIQILGVVMTGESNCENRRAIEQFGKTQVLAEIPPLPDFKKSTLLDCFKNQFVQGKQQHENEREQDLASVHTDAYCRPATQS